MTEIERYDRHGVDSWAPMMSDVIKLADYVSETEFVPKALRGKAPAIAASILAGREAGIPPMRALAHIHMVDGRPSMSAEQKRAQALAAGHEIAYAETTSTRCVVKGRRKGSEMWSSVTWTMDDARQAGLANKENWRKHPRRMLEARATGELCDMLFPDSTAGLATYEELSDGGDAAGVETDEHAAAKPRTAQRKRAPKTAAEPAASKSAAPAASTSGPPEPPLPGDEEQTGTGAVPPSLGEDVHDTEEMITRNQMKRLHATFGDLGYDSRDDRLHVASIVVGRPLDTSQELTKQEASGLIDTLVIVAESDDPVGNLSALLQRVQQAEGSDR